MEFEVKISGMSCGHCVKSVQSVLSEFEGVEQINVDLLTEKATYTSNNEIDLNLLNQKLNEKGGFVASKA